MVNQHSCATLGEPRGLSFHYGGEFIGVWGKLNGDGSWPLAESIVQTPLLLKILSLRRLVSG